MQYVDFGEGKMFAKDTKNILDYKDKILEKVPQGWTAKAVNENKFEIYHTVKIGVYEKELSYYLQHDDGMFTAGRYGKRGEHETFNELSSALNYIDKEFDLEQWVVETIRDLQDDMSELDCYKQLLHNKMFMIRREDFSLDELKYLLNK